MLWPEQKLIIIKDNLSKSTHRLFHFEHRYKASAALNQTQDLLHNVTQVGFLVIEIGEKEVRGEIKLGGNEINLLDTEQKKA